MTRRRYVQIEGELIEITPGNEPAPPRHDGVLWNDRSYQDASDPRFASRSQHREYMKRHGLTTVDDYKGHFDKAAARRAEHYTTGRDPTRRTDVERAIAQRSKP